MAIGTLGVTLKTLGKELDQITLSEIAVLLGEDILVECGDKEKGWMVEEWQTQTLKDILCDVLFHANDLYMDEIFQDKDIIKINQLVVTLRRPQ